MEVRLELAGNSVTDAWCVGTMYRGFEQILLGPATTSDGTMNIFGALRRAMATTGYSELKEFQRVEVTVRP